LNALIRSLKATWFQSLLSNTTCTATARALAREMAAGAMRTLRVLDLGGNGGAVQVESS
jgi:hypothetical protein